LGPPNLSEKISLALTVNKFDILYILWDTTPNLFKGGDMKKVFVVLLLLIGIFLINNAGVALAQPDDGENCQLYLANVTTDPDEPLGSWQECIEVCYEDGFAEAHTFCGPYEDDTLELTLEDFGVDSKNLVGFSTVYDKSCHAKLRGGRLRVLEADCLLDMYGGVRIHVKGKAISEYMCPCVSW
jgi:hypothetical protein